MIAAGMLYAVVISLLLTLAALAGERLFGLVRQPRRFVWLLVIVASPLLSCINIVSFTRAQPPSHVTELASTKPATILASRVHDLIELPLSRAVRPRWPVVPYWDSLLCALWALSSAAMMLGIVGTSLRFQRISKHWPAVQVNGRSIKVAERIGPALFGVLRPQVILPRWLLDAPSVMRSIVIAHEESHLAAQDSRLLIVAQLIVALAPWNLPAWWQLRRLRYAIEVDCDARVLQTSIDVVSYGEALLAIAEHQQRLRLPFGAVALTEPSSQLERRIRVMLSKTPRNYPLLAGVFAALSATFVAYATQLQVPAAPSTASPVAVQQEAAPEVTSSQATADPPQLPNGVSGEDASRVPSSRRDQVFIDADQINCHPERHSCTWSGHIKVSSKGFQILADKAVNFPKPGPMVMALYGSPATFTHTLSSGADIARGAADRIVLDGATGELTLTGHASLTQSDGATVTGERLTYTFP